MNGDMLLVDAVAAGVVDHHLKAMGAGLLDLRDAIRRILKRSRGDGAEITNDDYAAGQMADRRSVRFLNDDGRDLEIPPILATIERDDDMDWRFEVEALEIAPDAIFLETKLGPTIALERELPETLAAAVRGERLDAVLSHPALDGMDLRIQSVRQNGGSMPLVRRRPMGTLITLSPAGRRVLPMAT